MYKIICVLLLLCLPLLSMANSTPNEQTLEKYKALIKDLRCPKCINQSLADSNSIISNDLKNVVLKKIESGESPESIQEFLIARYGDFIVYNPPLQNNTLLLWLAPLIFLILGAFTLIKLIKNNRSNKNL